MMRNDADASAPHTEKRGSVWQTECYRIRRGCTTIFIHAYVRVRPLTVQQIVLVENHTWTTV